MTDYHFKNDGTLKQKYSYIPESIKRISKKLRENSIQPNIIKGDMIKTFNSLKKQHHELSLELTFEKQRDKEREQSLDNFCIELRRYNIKPELVGNTDQSYLKVRKQWEVLRKDIQDEKYPARLEKQNEINRDRYDTSSNYRNHKKKISAKQYVDHVKYVEKLELENQRLKGMLKSN